MSQATAANPPEPKSHEKRRSQPNVGGASQPESDIKPQDVAANQSSTQQAEDDSSESEVGSQNKSEPLNQSNVQTEGDGQKRSPEQQAEVERIGSLEPYAGTKRDRDLEKQLNNWRDLRACVRLISTDSLGLSQALDYYTKLNVKRRADLVMIPAPVVRIRAEQPGGAIDLFKLILAFLGNPLDFGNLWQFRSRAKGTLRSFRSKTLIVEDGHLLSLEALIELKNISKDLKISIVLAGSPSLTTLLNPESHKKRKDDWIDIHNTFLENGNFNPLSPQALATVARVWEEQGVRWSNPLNLWEDQEILAILYDYTQGQVGLLYENLRKIYVWKIDNPSAQVNYKNVDAVIQNRLLVISR